MGHMQQVIGHTLWSLQDTLPALLYILLYRVLRKCNKESLLKVYMVTCKKAM